MPTPVTTTGAADFFHPWQGNSTALKGDIKAGQFKVNYWPANLQVPVCMEELAFGPWNSCANFAVPSKSERMKIFLERLGAEKPARTADGAVTLLSGCLNAVEDEFSGIPYNPSLWVSDGRMYPPQEDSFRRVPDRPSLRRCRSRGHNTYFGKNGSIRIEGLDGEILLDKPGDDGRTTHELDS
jgi:hypothetical protein